MNGEGEMYCSCSICEADVVHAEIPSKLQYVTTEQMIIHLHEC